MNSTSQDGCPPAKKQFLPSSWRYSKLSISEYPWGLLERPSPVRIAKADQLRVSVRRIYQSSFSSSMKVPQDTFYGFPVSLSLITAKLAYPSGTDFFHLFDQISLAPELYSLLGVNGLINFRELKTHRRCLSIQPKISMSSTVVLLRPKNAINYHVNSSYFV